VLVHLLRTLKGDGDMTVFEAISLMIAFATLVVLIVKSEPPVKRVVCSRAISP